MSDSERDLPVSSPQQAGGPVLPRQALAVLLAGGLLSAGAWALTHRLLRQKAQVLFKAEVDREEESLAGRLDQNLEVIKAAQALLDASDEVTPAEWTTFGTRFGVGQRLNGMRSTGFMPLVQPGQVQAFEAAQQRERPKFKVNGESPGPWIAPLTLMHPWSAETKNLLGLDILSLPSRRSAILQAIDSGEAIITDPLDVGAVSAGPRKHPGAVIYAPLYRRGEDSSSPGARRAAATGIVFISYYTDELLRNTLRVHPDLRVMVTDGITDDPTRMLFESRPPHGPFYFHYDSTRTVAGRLWSLHYEAARDFGLGQEKLAPRWVLAGGILLTLLLAALTRSLALRRLREERLLAELTESEARFRAVTETTDNAILLYWDTISYVNPGAARLLGVSREELLGRSPLSLIHPEDRALAAETLEARKAGEVRPRRWEFRLLRPDGSVRWADLSATTVMFQGQKLILATALDITDRIAAEKARIDIERKLFEARRIQSLGLIAGGLSHDFNNLVTTIQGNLARIELVIADGSPAHAFLNPIRFACQRATDLTHAMLAYAGDAHFHWQRLDLNALIQVTVAQELGGLRSGQDILTELDEGLANVEGDPDQLAHALRELLENAVEALPESGKVRVSSGMEPVDLASLDFDFFNPETTVGVCVWLEVADGGSGMEPDVKRHMFDPFFTTKFSGRGLGLASVHGIMRSHRGGIRVESAPGRGTRVRLYFPGSGSEGAAVEKPVAD